MVNKNPFKEGSKQYYDFEVMKDLRWHCSKCELKSGQAKTWQVWRQEKGLQVDTDSNGNYYKIIYCDNCKEKTYHRKLKSLKILEVNKLRAGISAKFAVRVKEIYKNEEAVFLRKFSPNQLEVDHKFPQIRWNQNEDENKTDMSEKEIRDKFILLTRSNNLLKSRHCEKCCKTGKRGNFPGIYFWFRGDEDWDEKIDKHDARGCEGCFWNDPYKWREELNKILEDNDS